MSNIRLFIDYILFLGQLFILQVLRLSITFSTNYDLFINYKTPKYILKWIFFSNLTWKKNVNSCSDIIMPAFLAPVKIVSCVLVNSLNLGNLTLLIAFTLGFFCRLFYDTRFENTCSGWNMTEERPDNSPPAAWGNYYFFCSCFATDVRDYRSFYFKLFNWLFQFPLLKIPQI